MIHGILTFQFTLSRTEKGDIEPEFIPILFEFNDERFSEDNYSKLIVKDDIFSVFYQHTIGVFNEKGAYSNYYQGRLKQTPYQVMSYFRHEATGTQFLAIAIFSLEDEVLLFDELFKNLGRNLDTIFETLDKAKKANQVSIVSNIIKRLGEELKFAIFQIDRLSRLDKLQKAALIFKSNERLEILKTLREGPISKIDMKNKLEMIKENPKIDMLLEPFLELNLVHRDWIKGQRNKDTGIVENQGEYLFLTKDVVLARFPNETLLSHLKDNNKELYEKYREKVSEYFAGYDPLNQTEAETKKIASILLNPDLYDNFVLMRNKYYPVDKIPKIFSDFVDQNMMIDTLKDLDIITEIEDDDGRNWLLLLTDVRPLIVFPLYQLKKLQQALKSYDKEKVITHEIAKKALDLLEVSYAETVEF
ncbi:MAG: hypothetical protein GF353_00745 [Candidatus Lokiarchaeota archaeon]|nr:hypothetical protein [Candidatus Lokiarchaeota archaeon]